ncbi:hypothetical protein [Sediminibacterium goheungense]|uniref:Uncharacterized protein n=1 Tax=Sediminibacterium goheungense TaxID=1086393 RepID=A0A4R6IZ36_9BACT|nr:hypothetical protein [Sediminibacterium goheungense]TDO27226.1 hypothetical protein BC659_2547 [Sediminibacterium goheungense]
MSNPTKQHYSIPLQYRKMENLHIVFWLFKDIAWCLGFKILGITMIVPTLSIALLISWRTRKMMSELCHNIAIAVWISANSYWMISEFLGFDEKIVWGEYTYKHLALIPFGIGVLVLAFYYLIWRPKHKEENETM